jgi:hypothetical protein
MSARLRVGEKYWMENSGKKIWCKAEPNSDAAFNTLVIFISKNWFTREQINPVRSVSYQVTLAGWQDWANLHLLGDCLLWAVFGKIQKKPKFLCEFFFRGNTYAAILAKNGWATFWAIFHRLTRSPCSSSIFQTLFSNPTRVWQRRRR